MALSCANWKVGNIDGLVQDCNNPIAKALELRQSCTKPSIPASDLPTRTAHTTTVCLTLILYFQIILYHHIDVIMTAMASQITSLTVVYSTVYSDADKRKHQSSASLVFVWGIHRDRWIPRTNGQLRRKCFHFMTSSCERILCISPSFSNQPIWSIRLSDIDQWRSSGWQVHG